MVLFLKKCITTYKTKRIPQELQLRFLNRLSRLLFEGYPMIEALEVIKWDKEMINIANQIIPSLKRGHPLDFALQEANFHSTITNYLYFVRANGNIQANINKCIEMYEGRLTYIKKFQDIARYPLILLFIFSILLYFIQKSVLPSFYDLFQSSQESSQSILFFITIIQNSVTVFVSFFLFLLLLLLFWYFKKDKLTAEQQIKIYSKIPIYRKYAQLQVSFQFSMYLSTMLKSGLSLREILDGMKNQGKLLIMAYYAELMTRELSQGLGISGLLLELDFLDRRIAFIFRKNTDVNALQKDLAVYAELLTDELERKTMKILTLIQPIVFIFLACFVVFIYLTLMLPMYQLIKTI